MVLLNLFTPPGLRTSLDEAYNLLTRFNRWPALFSWRIAVPATELRYELLGDGIAVLGVVDGLAFKVFPVAGLLVSHSRSLLHSALRDTH